MTVPPSSIIEPVAGGEVVEEFLAGYWSARTRDSYTFILNGWFSWCAAHDHHPSGDVDPRVLEAWIRDLQARGYTANTIVGRVSAVSAFGLRCGELIACDVTDVGSHSWHHTLALRTTQGDKPTVVALAPPTMQAVAAAIDDRTTGPLLVNRRGRRMTPYNVTCATWSPRSRARPGSANT